MYIEKVFKFKMNQNKDYISGWTSGNHWYKLFYGLPGMTAPYSTIIPYPSVCLNFYYYMLPAILGERSFLGMAKTEIFKSDLQNRTELDKTSFIPRLSQAIPGLKRKLAIANFLNKL